MIYGLGEERNTFFCHWDVLLGYSRKIQTGEVDGGEFPGLNQKRSGIFRDDQEKIMWNFH